MRTSSTLVALTLAVAFFAAASSREQALLRAHALADLGRKMFFDPSLSASGKLSCASCHDPKFAYGPPQRARRPAGRHTRSPIAPLTWHPPQFTEHYFGSDDDADGELIDNGPTGGLTWDGRVDRLRDQARLPLFSPREMANKDASERRSRCAKCPLVRRTEKTLGQVAVQHNPRSPGSVATGRRRNPVHQQIRRFPCWQSHAYGPRKPRSAPLHRSAKRQLRAMPHRHERSQRHAAAIH